MMKYKIQVNNGVEAFGTQGQKTITANEVVENVDSQFMAHHMHLHNALIPEEVATAVLDLFCETAAELMGQGYAVVLKAKGEAALRLYPDIHLRGGNINLERAHLLDASVSQITVDNAVGLVNAVGLNVRAKAECEVKMTELMLSAKSDLKLEGVAVKETVMRRTEEDDGLPLEPNTGDNPTPDPGDNTGDNPGGDTPNPGGDDNGGDLGE